MLAFFCFSGQWGCTAIVSSVVLRWKNVIVDIRRLQTCPWSFALRSLCRVLNLMYRSCLFARCRHCRTGTDTHFFQHIVTFRVQSLCNKGRLHRYSRLYLSIALNIIPWTCYWGIIVAWDFDTVTSLPSGQLWQFTWTTVSVPASLLQ